MSDMEKRIEEAAASHAFGNDKKYSHVEQANMPFTLAKDGFITGAEWMRQEMENGNIGECDSCGEFSELKQGKSTHDRLCVYCR